MRQVHVKEQVSRAMAQQAGPLNKALLGASEWEWQACELEEFENPDMVPGCFLNLKRFDGVQGKGRNDASGGWAPHLCCQCANGSGIAQT